MQLPGLALIESDLRNTIESQIRRSGIMYRLFSRVKEQYSIEEKIERKGYTNSEKLMQDIVGFRIVTYFNDDVKTLYNFFEKFFSGSVGVYDNPNADQFKPLRKNLICPFDEYNLKIFNDIKIVENIFEYVDCTFEVQFRTTFSEGWHEIEHAMRYKCVDEWTLLDDESRMLNGIYASLETNDHSLKSLFDDIAYKHYKSGNWTGMLRNKFRMKFKLGVLDVNLSYLFDSNQRLAKEILKIDRNDLLTTILNRQIRMNISLENIVYLCNYIYIQDENIFRYTPQILIDDFNTYLS